MKEKFEKWLSDNSITEVECLVADLGGIARGGPDKTEFSVVST